MTALAEIYSRLSKSPAKAGIATLKSTLVTVIGQNSTPQGQAALRQIADSDVSQKETVAQALSRFPTAENYSYLLPGLQSGNKLPCSGGASLRLCSRYRQSQRSMIRRVSGAAAGQPQAGCEKRGWQVVRLLRHWNNNRQFGADDADWQTELASWSKWFVQSFPKEAALPDVASDKPVESKYKFSDLLAFLEKDGKTGDAQRGRLVFEKRAVSGSVTGMARKAKALVQT